MISLQLVLQAVKQLLLLRGASVSSVVCFYSRMSGLQFQHWSLGEMSIITLVFQAQGIQLEFLHLKTSLTTSGSCSGSGWEPTMHRVELISLFNLFLRLHFLSSFFFHQVLALVQDNFLSKIPRCFGSDFSTLFSLCPFKSKHHLIADLPYSFQIC